MRRKAFTLIELLVVIAIIAILAALLMPALESARAAAETTKCMANMRNLSLGVEMYVGTNNDFLPRNTLQGLGETWGVGAECPADPGYTAPGPIPGQNSHMGWWANKIYEFMPSVPAYWCDAFAQGEAWDTGGAVRNNGALFYTTIWGPYGYPLLCCFSPMSGLSDVRSIRKKSDIARLGGTNGEVWLYGHPEAGLCGYTNLYTNTLYPGYWPGWHKQAQGTPCYDGDSAKITFKCGTNGYIFADAHVEFLAWKEARARTDCMNGKTMWIDEGASPSEGCVVFTSTQGISSWCGTAVSKGEKYPSGY